jgi:ABC-2 type transport system permease protein
MMSKVFAIILKDLRLRFASPSEWLFFLLLPILFTFVLSSGQLGEAGDNRVLLLVVDKAQTSLSAQFLQSLNASSLVRSQTSTAEVAERAFAERKASLLLTVPVGFDEAAVLSGTAVVEFQHQPNDINALMAEQAIQAELAKLSASLDIAQMSTTKAAQLQPFADSAAQQAYFNSARTAAQNALQSAPNRLQVSIANTADPIDYDPTANNSAGQLITWVFIPLIGISALFAYERQQGTLRRLLTSPTAKATFLFATILGQVLTALVQMVLLILFGLFVLRVNWGQDWLALGVLLTSAALAAAALGTALGTMVKTESQANGLSIMLGMVMALLGGCWYPAELFPAAVQNAVKVLPTTWAMQGLLDLLVRGGHLPDIGLEALVLLGFAGLFFGLGVWRFRYE